MNDKPKSKRPPPEQFVALNFLVLRDFRRHFKRRAVDADITQNELLHRAFEAWEEKHGLGKTTANADDNA